MASDRRQSAADARWWSEYNLGQMGIYTGSIANDVGMQYGGHYRQPAPPPIIAPKKPSAPPAVYEVPAVFAGGSTIFDYLVNGLLIFLGLGAAGKLLEFIRGNPSILIPFVVIGVAAALYWRRRR